MRRETLKRLILLIPLVGVLVGVEMTSLVYRSVRCPGDPPSYVIPNAQYGWHHPSKVTVKTFACASTAYEWKNTIEFNSSGLNDGEHDYSREASTPRILVLGDSVAEALQINRNENFSERLEILFKEDGRRVEVINTGHSGFGSDNEVLFYETEGHRYDPDVVLLEFNLQNDIAENSPTLIRQMYSGGPNHPKAGVILRDDGGVDLDTSDFSRAVALWESDPWRSSWSLAWLRRHSFFVRHFSNVIRGNLKPASAPPPPHGYPAELDVYAVPVDAEWAEARRITAALLRRLRSVVERNESRLVVAIVPSRETAEPRQWEHLVSWFPKLASGSWDLEMPRKWAIDYLTAEGFTVIDTTEVIRREQAETQSSGYFAFDPHPNAKGHGWIAEAVYPELSRIVSDIR